MPKRPYDPNVWIRPCERAWPLDQCSHDATTREATKSMEHKTTRSTTASLTMPLRACPKSFTQCRKTGCPSAGWKPKAAVACLAALLNFENLAEAKPDPDLGITMPTRASASLASSQSKDQRWPQQSTPAAQKFTTRDWLCPTIGATQYVTSSSRSCHPSVRPKSTRVSFVNTRAPASSCDVAVVDAVTSSYKGCNAGCQYCARCLSLTTFPTTHPKPVAATHSTARYLYIGSRGVL
mmetsp:Transcript_57631/g.160592  ORF Transcript_57631/g.160592 Transcript_57631/m.160592 type:complete len:237 (+) Transcript_57631:123-833(+)